MTTTIVFHGTDAKVGTTMVTQSVAEMLSEWFPNQKVLIACMHNGLGSEYAPMLDVTMETLKLQLDNRLLTADEILRGCRITKNRYQVAGITDYLLGKKCRPDAAVCFLTHMQEVFDWILVDSGSELDDGLAIGALLNGDRRILVATQHESALARWDRLKAYYETLQISFERIVVNRYQDEIYDCHYLSKRLQRAVTDLCCIRSSPHGRSAERERKSLYRFNEKGYREDLELLCTHLVNGEGRREQKRNKEGSEFGRFFFGRLFKNRSRSGMPASAKG